jgi:hypothetical protein
VTLRQIWTKKRMKTQKMALIPEANNSRVMEMGSVVMTD